MMIPHWDVRRQPIGDEWLDDATLGWVRSQAAQARQRAYAPYSGFAVGAAVVTDSGRVYTGCNVENASYGLTICAERAAVFAAVAAGARAFVATVIVTGAPRPTMPCGACRQVLHEFGPAMQVVACTLDGQVERARLDALLPSAFGPADLGHGSARKAGQQE
jgi:cytidine deaminase